MPIWFDCSTWLWLSDPNSSIDVAITQFDFTGNEAYKQRMIDNGYESRWDMDRYADEVIVIMVNPDNITLTPDTNAEIVIPIPDGLEFVDAECCAFDAPNWNNRFDYGSYSYDEQTRSVTYNIPEWAIINDAYTIGRSYCIYIMLKPIKTGTYTINATLTADNTPLTQSTSSSGTFTVEYCGDDNLTKYNTKKFLKFICESADYPVFKDYKINVPANRTIKFLIDLIKSVSGITAKLQIIDPANDPLIDSTTTPLHEVIAGNNINNQQLGIEYKSDTAKELILRILCQSASGEVQIDVNRIENMLQKRFVSIW